ncbi:hypothetical protein [Sinorhizobium americanum]|uniref:Uncharacterized protein n=1 Tax=Sinorhizobium americanum TaxID=194963 RepID=A0A1L3LWY0_9HYPH|nr:hypothetical protein SAMCFNEI73_pC0895 [Sinorhizobium americanum]
MSPQEHARTDSISATVKQAEALVAEGHVTSKRSSYASSLSKARTGAMEVIGAARN